MKSPEEWMLTAEVAVTLTPRDWSRVCACLSTVMHPDVQRLFLHIMEAVDESAAQLDDDDEDQA